MNESRVVSLPEWRTNADGEKKLHIYARTIDALCQHYPNRIRYNQFTSVVEFCDAPWTDATAREVTEVLQRADLRCGIDVVHDAAARVAEANAYDPLRDWLRSLRWDGAPRLDGWLTRYLGVPATVYTRAVGRAWLISAVARALRPGCKADAVLVLEGPQGIGKSSLITTLANGFSRDDLSDLSSKDARIELQGAWIVEIAELSAVNRSAVEKLKVFLSAREDSFRPPYGRVTQVFPRRCVFVATTNDEAYLRDSTGNRRFWPVRCTNVALDDFRRDRDILLAEAVAAFEGGAEWWLSREHSELAAHEATERAELDPWEEVIVTFASRNLAGVTMTQVLSQLGLSERLHAATGITSKRIASILRRNGFQRTQRTSGGKREWCYVRKAG